MENSGGVTFKTGPMSWLMKDCRSSRLLRCANNSCKTLECSTISRKPWVQPKFRQRYGIKGGDGKGRALRSYKDS